MNTSSPTPADVLESNPAHSHPLVSVVIPAYNAADLTVETVESVLAQTYSDVEVIVVDDGSTDHTRPAMSPFGSRISYIYKENGGACSARNAGLRASRGEYVAFLDCDDLWLPTKAERSVAALQAYPEAGMVFTSCLIVDGSGETIDEYRKPVNPADVHSDLLRGNFIPAPTVVMRRKSVDEIGLFDEHIFVPADWDYWLRMSAGFPVCYVDESLSKYRFSSNYSIRNVERSLEEIEYVLKKHLDLDSPSGEQVRRDVLGQACLDFALSFRTIGELRDARRLVRRAVGCRPSGWRVYAHFAASLLGHRIWSLTSRPRSLPK